MKDRIAEIVAAYVGNNAVPPDQLPVLIQSVSTALSGLGQPSSPAASALTPVVPIRRSVTSSRITCLDCGWTGQMLKRHLMNAHALSVKDYRARWGLATDYPMVARDYASRRSELAKAIGLGRLQGRPRGRGHSS